MRRIITIILAVLLALCLAVPAFADKATKGEIIAKVKEAATMITNKGQDTAFKEINNKEGKFVWKDTYVFVLDFEGTLLARPFRQGAIGKNWMAWKESTDCPNCFSEQGSAREARPYSRITLPTLNDMESLSST